jgi:hypothetical protein
LQRCYNHRAVVVLMVAMVLTATALTDGWWLAVFVFRVGQRGQKYGPSFAIQPVISSS